MKHVIASIFFAFALINAKAQQAVKSQDETAWDYIMMKRGQLLEVEHGHRIPVKKDIMLVNETTIHPDGTIDVSSGKTRHLREGQYITMDGRIRKLRDTVMAPAAANR